MHHPDISHEVNRRHYADLLEEARLERLAALGEASPDFGARFSRVRAALSEYQVQAERKRRLAPRAGLNPAS